MLAKIVGLQQISFKNPDGKVIEGTKIFTEYPDENVMGVKTEAFFVKQGIKFPESLKAGEQVNIYFNQKGKVEAITK